ncbi:hypothetical protein EDB19DRAFT_1582828, partial [Suillus lakei]
IKPIDFYCPCFFVWLPHLFHRIPCPACNAAQRCTVSGQPVMLHILSWPKWPCCVVDIEHLVFIIGHHYYCGHGDCKKTYQSWSPAILNSIPAPLTSQFSFHLTHRCGLSDQMVAILRASFQRGIGPHPFAEIVRRMHLRFYKLRHLEYLETVRQLAQSTAAGLLAPHLPFPRWGDPSGYGGYTPSHRYFQGFYDAMIEQHAGDIDQHMAMLSAELLSHDHSFKVCNSIVKSCRVLIGDLLQVTAILGKVDGMTLTPTKGHKDCMPALAEIPATLVKYGHSPVKVVFTDNVRGDKEALEGAFPSLLDGVNPVPSSSLEDLEIPSDWDVCRLGSVFQVNGWMNSIMEDLSNGDLDSSSSSSRSELHVAMDMEWPVDRDTGIYGKVALISIAYGRTVFLIPYIHKVGVHIKADLTRLYKDCGFLNSEELPFVGALELRQMAKERNVTDNANISLSDLAATVLKCHLSKDLSIPLSTQWDSPSLPEAHQVYAALDTYASWSIFEAFTSIPISSPVTHETPPGTEVQIPSQTGNVPVAHGFVAQHQPKQHNGVNVTKMRIVITLTAIKIPG